MQKWNLGHIAAYTVAILIIVIYSIASSYVSFEGDMVQAYQKILFVMPVLFLVAALLAFKIAENGIVLIALSFLVLSTSTTILMLLEVFKANAGESQFSLLLSKQVWSGFFRHLPLLLPLTLSLVFLLPDKIAGFSTVIIKVLLSILPLAYIFFPGLGEMVLFGELEYGRLRLPWISITAALLPLAGPYILKNRRSGTFSAALTSALILAMLPYILSSDGSPAQTTYLFAGIILLHSIYRVYWENSYIDELTGLYNRRALDERMRRLRGGYSLSMADIDHFKGFNDTYGHDEGDNVLRLVAKMLHIYFGKTAYRYGGEEFCIVFPRTDAGTAGGEMEEARAAIEKHMFSIRRKSKKRKKASRKTPAGDVKKIKLTISAGVAESSRNNRDAVSVLKNADKALYKAKEGGRNRVEIIKTGR